MPTFKPSLILSFLFCFVASSSVLPQAIPSNGNQIPESLGFHFIVQVHISTSPRMLSTQTKTCSGTIVSPNVVITAAHCVVDTFGPAKANPAHGDVVKVVAGQTHWGQGQGRLVTKAFVFEEFYTQLGKFRDDIAILLLAYPLDFNEWVQAATIPRHGEQFVYKSPAIEVDWTEAKDPKPVHAEVELVQCVIYASDQPFNSTNRSNVELLRPESDGNILCANDSVGQGTSGSPILCEGTEESGRVVCGILSKVVGDKPGKSDEHRRPGVFTAVSRFSDQIRHTVAEYNFTCSSEQFNCGDGDCVSFTARCDHKLDCHRGTDEMDCAPCPVTQFRCTGRKCIEASFVCDGMADCPEGSDEEYCRSSWNTRLKYVAGAVISALIVFKFRGMGMGRWIP